MTTMAVLVDSNIILDVVTEDPVWAVGSDQAISLHQPDGLIVNPVIFAELCAGANSVDEVNLLLDNLKLELQEIPREGLFLAAKAFLKYRRSGGVKRSPLPDFLIGGHADALGLPILTRDAARYQTYFPTVRLIHP